MSKKIPAYCRHKASGQAYASLDGKRCYLGKHGSPESHRKYADLISGWQQEQTTIPKDLKVRQLTAFYWKHAQGYYVKNGSPSGHLHMVQVALKYLNAENRNLLAAEFGPKRLMLFRDQLIDRGLSRKYINDLVSVVKRMFRWALESELVPGAQNIQAMLTRGVAWAKKGRTKARETPRVKPVAEAVVDAIREHVPPQVWGMIELQRWTGMRPGEVVIMRGCDLNTSGEVWEYIPQSHKTEHHDRDRVVCIGKNGQAVLREWLRPELDRFLFSPRSDGLKPYRRDSYTSAIRRGCEIAFGMPGELRDIGRTTAKMKDATEEERLQERERLAREAAIWREAHCWSPNQLRHSFATRARREFGLEAARVTLGHSSAAVSEIYAERDQEAARAVVARIG
ncbi:MAG: tyrosine-type recombinase/integrase [Planctomycetaceae bacterium]|nr:tyrosine-type recombinase/integrase [Planctomycetaceae bacterium]